MSCLDESFLISSFALSAIVFTKYICKKITRRISKHRYYRDKLFKIKCEVLKMQKTYLWK